MSHAAEPAASASPSEAWHVSAERIDIDQARDQLTATGNVTIDRQGRTLTADYARLNRKSRQAFARGNVRLVSGEDVLSGDRLQINLDRETGTLTNGTLFISQNHLYLSGHKIHKTGLQTYAAEKASITSCDGPDPDWKITGRDLKVTIEGYGYAKHTTLWTGKVPVLYSPFLTFPAKLKRQSGLLMPEIELFSERKGNRYIQPLYWAINDHSDATVYADYMSDRGIRTGLEYRYVLNENSLGALMAEGYQDKRIDDGQGDASNRWGYIDDKQNKQLRLNKDRYWVRMKHDHGFESGLTAKLDIDVVSDQDYLSEFKSGYNGFERTRDYFRKTFGRDIDDYNDPVRLNRLNFNRIWNQYSFNTDLRWYDDVIKRRNEQKDDTLQRLPAISFSGVKHPLADTALYFDLESSYTNFYRTDGTRGHRSDLYPRIYYPTSFWQTLSVEPSVGVRQTAWRVDKYETQPEDHRNTFYRAIYDVKLDMSTEIFRLFDISMAGCDRLKHAITPEIVYEYTPDQDQSDLPQFDEVDNIQQKNLITYGFTNTFTARAPSHSKNKLQAYRYTPFMRFKLSQNFDIDKDREGDAEPFSGILAELDLTPGRYVALDTDTQWSPYRNEFEAFNTALHLWDLRGDSLVVDYRYTRETDTTSQDGDTPSQDGIESLRLDGKAVLSDRWRLRAGYEYDLYSGQEIESSVGVSYYRQCWAVDMDYWVEQDNYNFGIRFHLLGLGSIGM